MSFDEISWGRGVGLAAALALAATGATGATGCDDGGDDGDTGQADAAPDGAPADAGFEPWELEEPPAGGFFFRTPEFQVPPGTEQQNCYFYEVPDVNGGQPIFISRVKTAINPGSHHMNVFRVKTILGLDGEHGDVVENGECFKSPNWADWPLVANSQKSNPADPYTDWVLPDDVAHRFMPGEKLMIQVHYVNASTQDTPFGGKAGINFYASDDAAPMELGTLFATQQSIRVCQSNPTPSYSGACSFGSAAAVNIVAANGHFHSRGKRFSMFKWDGVSVDPPLGTDQFYESESWDDPPMSTDLAVSVVPQGGVRWTCDFQWFPPVPPSTCEEVNMRDKQMANDCCYTFGPTVEESEHCNAFVYYYPKSDDITCF